MNDKQQVCLLAEDITKDNWKSIHYGMAGALTNQLIRLNTYNYSHEYKATDGSVNPCPVSANLIVNGWHRNKFAPTGFEGRFQVLGNSYTNHHIRPDFAIGNFFAATQKAQLIIEHIHKQALEQPRITIALALGPETLASSVAMAQAFRQVLRNYPNIFLQKITYSENTKFQQYLAMTSLLLDGEYFDYVIGTPTAITQGSKIIVGRELQATRFIALTPSREIVNLIERGEVQAVIDDKPILQGRWLADWIVSKSYQVMPDVNFAIEIRTAQDIHLINDSDSFVPYGYRVIYNTGNY